MDVELEEMEEGVVDERDGAVDLALDAVVELERVVGLFTDGEGDELELVIFPFNVLARFPITIMSAHTMEEGCSLAIDLRASVHAFDLDRGAIVIRR